uniref:Uncharacterized protein n=1 Tax=Rousettus aegyptiacus TaxID=9407 RepID=A0A7J8B7Q3_ROUAE|nr:hypothetical protein HJG63_010450 [Rousettus aegyptiacus]
MVPATASLPLMTEARDTELVRKAAGWADVGRSSLSGDPTLAAERVSLCLLGLQAAALPARSEAPGNPFSDQRTEQRHSWVHAMQGPASLLPSPPGLAQGWPSPGGAPQPQQGSCPNPEKRPTFLANGTRRKATAARGWRGEACRACPHPLLRSAGCVGGGGQGPRAPEGLRAAARRCHAEGTPSSVCQPTQVLAPCNSRMDPEAAQESF